MTKYLLLLTISAALIASTPASAQVKQEQKAAVAKARPADKQLRASAPQGYGVSINNPETNDNIVKNPSGKHLLVVAMCNGTIAAKDLEAWVGQNSPATVQDMVASESGTGRQTITFVVPWGWSYYVNVSEQPGGGMPDNGTCKATAWWFE